MIGKYRTRRAAAGSLGLGAPSIHPSVRPRHAMAWQDTHRAPCPAQTSRASNHRPGLPRSPAHPARAPWHHADTQLVHLSSSLARPRGKRTLPASFSKPGRVVWRGQYKNGERMCPPAQVALGELLHRYVGYQRKKPMREVVTDRDAEPRWNARAVLLATCPLPVIAMRPISVIQISACGVVLTVPSSLWGALGA